MRRYANVTWPGFNTAEFTRVGHITDGIDGFASNGADADGNAETCVRNRFRVLCARLPIFDALTNGGAIGR